MRHTDAEIGEAASRFERLADNLGPATMKADDPSDLRAVRRQIRLAAMRR
jgi:hypothetical protein